MGGAVEKPAAFSICIPGYQVHAWNLMRIKVMLKQVIVSVVLFRLQEDTLQVLLNQVGGRYFLPALFPQEQESLGAAVNRLAASLLSVPQIHLQQLHTYGESGQPLKVVYLGVASPVAALAGVAGYSWHSLGSAFRMVAGEKPILELAMQELHHRVAEGSLVFTFLPAEFTLGELQTVWELIQGEVVDKRNFRRRILGSGLVEPTSRQRSGKGRPARLYRFRVVGKARGNLP
jgi:8-oxo-dGTP diphosphatase